MPNPLTNRFTEPETDLPPGVPPMAMGTATVTPRSASPVTPSLGDRAKASLQRALAGMSGLLGRQVNMPDRTSQPAAAQSPPPTPNILTTIPRLAPIATPPPPVGTPTQQPTPYSLNGWLSGQSAKG